MPTSAAAQRHERNIFPLQQPRLLASFAIIASQAKGEQDNGRSKGVGCRGWPNNSGRLFRKSDVHGRRSTTTADCGRGAERTSKMEQLSETGIVTCVTFCSFNVLGVTEARLPSTFASPSLSSLSFIHLCRFLHPFLSSPSMTSVRVTSSSRRRSHFDSNYSSKASAARDVQLHFPRIPGTTDE